MKKMLLTVMVAGILTVGGGNAFASPVFHTNGISDILAIQRERAEQKAPVAENKVEQKIDSKKIVIKNESSSKKVSSYTPLMMRSRGIGDVLEIMKEWSLNQQAK